MATADEVGTSITEVAKQCQTSLHRCLRIQPLMQYEWAENRLAEFNLWAAGSGAFAGHRASLDARLALELETQTFVISILILLLECIRKCEHMALGLHDEKYNATESVLRPLEVASPSTDSLETPELMPRSFSPWSDMSSSESESGGEEAEASECSPLSLESAKGEVHQILDHLARIAVAIRKSGTNFRYQKADRLFQPATHEQLRAHLSIVVLARGSEAGRGRWVASSLTPIQERLIRANLMRRNRFLYAQRHAQKLAIDADSTSHKFSLTQFENPILMPAHTSAGNEGINVTYDINAPTFQELRGHQSVVMSATTASAVEVQIEEVARQPPTQSQMAKTNITSTATRLTYPRPPRLRDGIRYFQCPCCCQVLPELFRQETQWRKHLMKDICPYSCILEDCPTPDTLYSSRHEWTQHVQRDHPQCWECIPCKTPGRLPLMFPSVDGLLSHVERFHGDTIKENQYQALVESAAVPIPTGISQCPLCDETGAADSEPLLSHIAEHMHEFALRSLPWPHDCDAGDTENHRGYFETNDYFDDASDGQSSRYSRSDGSGKSSGGLASLPSNGSSVHSRSLGDGVNDDPFQADSATRLDSGSMFACPFLKRDPTRYSDRQECISLGRPTIPRLKEHIYRVHMLHPHECKRCGETFASKDLLVHHQEAAEACKWPMADYAAGITIAQRKELRKTDVTTLQEIHNIVFSNHESMPSPNPELTMETNNTTESSPIPLFSEPFEKHNEPGMIVSRAVGGDFNINDKFLLEGPRAQPALLLLQWSKWIERCPDIWRDPNYKPFQGTEQDTEERSAVDRRPETTDVGLVGGWEAFIRLYRLPKLSKSILN